MLIAQNKINIRLKAWEAEKDQGPFFCPECGDELTLKKGKVREPHFAHKQSCSCDYGSGETEIHYKAKRTIYSNLCKHPDCTNVEIESNLFEVRPDISFCIKNNIIVIELQKSNISVEEIIRKARIYNRNGIFLLYLFPVPEPKKYKRYEYTSPIEGNVFSEVCRPSQWEKYIHSLYFGRVYYWIKDLYILKCHYDDYNIWIDYNDFGGGYSRRSKQMKIPLYKGR